MAVSFKKYYGSTLKKLTQTDQAQLNRLFKDCVQMSWEFSSQTNKADETDSLIAWNLPEIEEYLKLYENAIETEFRTNRKKITKQYTIALHITDIILLIHRLLFELLTIYFAPKDHRKINKKISSNQRACFTYLFICYDGIINSLYECRKNMLEGKMLIADVLFRHFMEIFDNAILALVDEGYFMTIKDRPVDKGAIAKRWNEIKPSAVKQKLNKHIDRYLEQGDLNAYIKDLKNILYHLTSKSTHGDFHSVFSASFKSEDGSEEKFFNPYGYDKAATSEYFNEFIIYNYSMILVLFTAFISHHHLPFKYFGKTGREIGVMFKYFEAVMKNYLGNISDQT